MKFQRLCMCGFFLMMSLMGSYASAQASFAPPPVVPYGAPITLETAKKAASGAIAEAQKNKWRMAVAIVDTGGHLVYFERMQDTQIGSVDLAIEKAKTAALFRRSTKLFQDAVAGGGEGLRLLRLTGAIPIDGGIPIIENGKLVGAVGISGGSGDQDGQTALAGAAAVK
jgi:uncharacterized protein GlcG (DUF336 family)